MFKSFSTLRKKHVKSHSTVSYPLPAPSPCLIPPLLIIRATCYSDKNSELFYKNGDFLHVIGEDTDPDKFFVCDPISNRTGWIEKNKFEIITKAKRTNKMPTSPLNRSNSLTPVSSRTGSTTTVSPRTTDTTFNASLLVPPSPNSSFHSRNKSAPHHAYSFETKSLVIAFAMYDFSAERQDELSISKGDQLSICAKSDNEWMVCKHIGRPIGPGLVPRNYLEFRDFDNGNLIPNLEEFLTIKNTLLPTVLEWKALSTQITTTSFTSHSRSSSENTCSQPRHSQVPSLEHSPLEHPTSHSLSTTSSLVQPHSPTHSAPLEASPLNLSEPSLISLATPPLPTTGEIHRVINDNSLYYYIIEVNYSHQGMRRILYRLYEDFQIVHHQLTQQFQSDTDILSLLPLLPPPISYIDASVANRRKPSLNLYFQQLLALPKEILLDDIIQSFLNVRSKDIELEVQFEDTQRFTNMTINSSSFFVNENDSSEDETTSSFNPNGSPLDLDSIQSPTSPLRVDHSFLEAITHNNNNEFIKAKVVFQGEILAFKVPKSEGLSGLITRINLRLEEHPSLTLQIKDMDSVYQPFDINCNFDEIEKSKTGQLVIYATEPIN